MQLTNRAKVLIGILVFLGFIMLAVGEYAIYKVDTAKLQRPILVTVKQVVTPTSTPTPSLTPVLKLKPNVKSSSSTAVLKK